MDDECITDDTVAQIAMVMESGQIIQQPQRLSETMDALVLAAKVQYLSVMTELDNDEIKAESMGLAAVRTRIGGRFIKTNKLKVINSKKPC